MKPAHDERFAAHAGAGPAPGRLRFWEIENMLVCPVVGLCLSQKEQRQILKKAGVKFKKRDEFEIHEILVACASDENRISRRIDRMLLRTHGSRAQPLYELDAAVFERLWKSFFAEGDVGLALWVAASRTDLSTAFRREVFGDVHMAMHGNAEHQARLKRQITGQKKKIEEKTRQAREAVQENRTLAAEAAVLRRERVELVRRLEAAEEQNRVLREKLSRATEETAARGLAAENRRMAQELEALGETLGQREAMLAESEARLCKAQKEIGRWKASLEAIQAEARAFLKSVGAMQACDASCPAFDLCRKRVLVVGGMSRISGFYRELVEDVGGVFEYHDGYTKNGVTALENRLRRADMVLCPVNCNSHSACALVKKLGKKHNKPVHMLSGASLNAVSRALRQGDECCINPHLAN